MGTRIKKTPSFPSTKEPASAEALPSQFSRPLPAEPRGEGKQSHLSGGFKAPPPSLASCSFALSRLGYF